MAKTKIERLYAALEAAQEQYRDVRLKRDREVMDLVNEYKRKVETECNAKYGAELQRLKRLSEIANLNYTAEQERLALRGDDAPFPLGTKLVRMSDRSKFGIVEVVLTSTTLPDNVNNARFSCCKPSVGDFIVRILKMDGTPAKTFDRDFKNWEPVFPIQMKKSRTSI